MKGIILAGGSGSRLFPATQVMSKQSLPVYDKPMIYYPLSTLMEAGIRDILIISTPRDLATFRNLLGDGEELGLCFSYAEQERPNGIAEAFIIGRHFIGGEGVALVLGDNIFYGPGLPSLCRQASCRERGATLFAFQVPDAHRYGVFGFDESSDLPLSIEEKPSRPASNWIATGLYFYDNDVVGLAQATRPSARGEREITDINRAYLEQGLLRVEKLGRGNAWFDTGTHDSLHEAASFVRSMEQRLGIKIACPEEIALAQGWIEPDRVLARAMSFGQSTYADHLHRLVAEHATP